ncbi:MAG TPA: hypothetical protein VEQ85_10385, partial [Lacipirellulaceae bacterium]|nr:hypothetical protein [Lacipirellulaceae bacterium]
MTHRFAALLLSLSAALATPSLAQAANITWNGGNGAWADGAGNDPNWTPADEPDANDVAIFSTNNLVTMGTSNQVLGLTLSASAELQLDGNDLTVDGLTSLSGGGTRLIVAGAGAALAAQDIAITADAEMFLDGGSVLATIPGGGAAVITTSAGGTLSGNGDFVMNDAIAAVTTTINNNGEIVASNPSSILLVPPVAATLRLSTADLDARIDLDGSLETGAVTVSRNQTLEVDGTLADIFNGAVTLAHNTKLDVSTAWTLGVGATIDVDNGATAGIGAIPAGTAIIAGPSFAQNAGTIAVLDPDGTLQFDAPFSMNGGTLTNNGHVIFNQNATIGAAANLAMVGDADLTVEAGRTVNINQTSFNFDGGGAGGTVVTVNSQATLNLNVSDYDSDAGTNGFDGVMNINDGDVSVITADAEFVMDGVLNMTSSVEGQIVTWSGEPIDIGNDAGTLDADLNILGTRHTQFGGEVDFNSDADVTVVGGATLALLSTVNFDTVGAGTEAALAGAGTMVFSGQVNVNEAVTLNLVGGAVDLDGLDNLGDLINLDAPMTINAATMASFGRNNGAGGVNTIDVNNDVGTGSLTVNLDSPSAEWTLNAEGVINLVNNTGAGTLLAGSDLNVNGTLNVTGDVRT